jgi:hypothetical protein
VSIGISAGDRKAEEMLAALVDARGDIQTSGLFDLADHAAPTPIPPADPSRPPGGAWHRDDGLTLEFGASTRNIGAAVGMLFVAAIWNAVSWGVAAMGARGVVIGLGVLARTERGPAGIVGGLMVLMSVPFVLLGAWLVCHACMYVAGRVVVSRRGDDVSVFTGVGPLGKTRRLRASSIQSVEEHVKVTRGKHGPSTTRTAWIRNRDGGELKVGDLLPDARRVWVIGMLRRVAMGGRGTG